MYWKKFTSANRYIIEISGFFVQVFPGSEAGEKFEVIDEMSLVVITAFQGQACPVDLLRRIDLLYGFLKADDLEKPFRGHPHIVFKKFDQVFL